MRLEELRSYLDGLLVRLENDDQALLRARLESLPSVFPFNEYEYILTFLVDRGILSFSEYEELRGTYVSGNRYLDLYGLAPRIFGQIWGESHLQDVDQRLVKANRRLDPSYTGEYDLWLQGVRIEVKAARAIHTLKRGSLLSKALHFNSESPFWMNFQQLKLDVCDVFVFIGVWVDQIVYWVLSNNEVKNSRYLSHQHRGGIEYQIGITDRNIRSFQSYVTRPNELVQTILTKASR